VSGRRHVSADGRVARYRYRRIALANGETLALRSDGTIERRDPAGVTVERWAEDDPGWAAPALRFGIRASAETVVPRGRDVPGTKPPV